MCELILPHAPVPLYLNKPHPLSVKVATVTRCKRKAVLVNDKTQGAEPTAKPQQFIEVSAISVPPLV